MPATTQHIPLPSIPILQGYPKPDVFGCFTDLSGTKYLWRFSGAAGRGGRED